MRSACVASLRPDFRGRPARLPALAMLSASDGLASSTISVTSGDASADPSRTSVVVANHPLGAIDGLLLISLLVACEKRHQAARQQPSPLHSRAAADTCSRLMCSAAPASARRNGVALRSCDAVARGRRMSHRVSRRRSGASRDERRASARLAVANDGRGVGGAHRCGGRAGLHRRHETAACFTRPAAFIRSCEPRSCRARCGRSDGRTIAGANAVSRFFGDEIAALPDRRQRCAPRRLRARVGVHSPPRRSPDAGRPTARSTQTSMRCGTACSSTAAHSRCSALPRPICRRCFRRSADCAS